jgi:hypothetical protein
MQKAFISMSWTPGVDSEDAQVLISTLEETYISLRKLLGRPGQFDPLPTVRVFGAWAIPSIPAGTAYSNVEWYLNRSLDDRKESVLASRYLETVRCEPWQASNPHFDLAMTDYPVVNDVEAIANRVDVLGMSQPGLVSLITAHPFELLVDKESHRMALRHSCAHYLGRLLDIPSMAHRSDLQKRNEVLFCPNVCAMRFTESAQQALEYGRQESDDLYCPQCQKDLLGQIVAFHYGVN